MSPRARHRPQRTIGAASPAVPHAFIIAVGACLLLGCATAPVMRCVVRLTAPGSGGAGAIIGQQGNAYLVLTAGHVVARCRGPVRVDAFEPCETGVGQVVAHSKAPDLALLRVTFAHTHPVLPMADTARGGQRVTAYGCPGGMRVWWQRGETVGPAGPPYFAAGHWGLTTSVVGGYSGGPVVDADGRLVGVVVGGLMMRLGPAVTAAAGVGIMVPVQAVRAWMRGVAK